jgi:hypothetical protein
MGMLKSLKIRKEPKPKIGFAISDNFHRMNMLWYGGYAGSLENLTVIHPVPQLPKLHHLTFNDAPAYRGLIAEFDDAVMVVDSPPHQSKLTIQWVQQTLHRNVTHLLVSLNC